MKRELAQQQASEILDIIKLGSYLSSRGERVDFSEEQARSVEETQLYTPEMLERSRDDVSRAQASRAHATISVEAGTTQEVAHRVCVEQRSSRESSSQESSSRESSSQEGSPQASLALLNFASARNPGGGFLRGARAQEEDLCRCSGLYPSLLTQPTYYEANREQSSMIYTDHAIYSPRVPLLKVKSHSPLLDEPVYPSVITMPAPNTGPFLQRKEGELKDLEVHILRRWRNVIAIANHNQHTDLLLGAWGCGAFQGDARLVATMAKRAIELGTGTVERVIFAIPDKGKRSSHNLSVFREVLESR